MNKNKAAVSIGLVVVIGLIAILLVVGGMYMHYSNEEIRLRNLITAKQADNESELDNMQKKIMQSAGITKEAAKTIRDIVVGNSEARTKGSGSLATLVREAVPNTDQTSKTFLHLMDIVTGSRDRWTSRQKEILDMNREHDNAIDVSPSSWVCGSRPKIHVIIVTSAAAKEAFRTGEDNDTQLFK